jgi:murein DD-endopeptidase MepM/ murein hydrolase activator NlpD
VRVLTKLIVIALLAAAGVYFAAGYAAAPQVEIVRPQRVAGAQGSLEFVVDSPGSQLSRLDAVLEQGEQRWPLFALGSTGEAAIKQESADRMRVTRAFGRRTLPGLREGAARIVVTAVRPVLYATRSRETTVTRDITFRLEPPRIAVVSTHHYVNHGGSEMVVYDVTPPDVESGIRVGDVEYPGFPASGAGVAGAAPSRKVAFMALLYDQDLDTPMWAYARDEAGNTGRADFDYRAFPKPMRRSRIELDDKFLGRVVPAIFERTPELTEKAADGQDLLSRFLTINGDLRRRNAAQIAALAARTAPEIMWRGAFDQLTNSQVEASFADYRTYYYKNREVDRQVHLGFDLAVTAAVPIRAANRGKVLHGDYLGIYGNTVILDHGMGVQSLYAHLSSIGVKDGDMVEKGQELGRSGMTGLAGGDHLHYTVLIHGRPVSPVDWWDAHWIEDRVARKLKDAATR